MMKRTLEHSGLPKSTDDPKYGYKYVSESSSFITSAILFPDGATLFFAAVNVLLCNLQTKAILYT
jgi:hypothetical protein